MVKPTGPMSHPFTFLPPPALFSGVSGPLVAPAGRAPETRPNPYTLTTVSGHHMISRAAFQAFPCSYQPSSVPSHTELW